MRETDEATPQPSCCPGGTCDPAPRRGLTRRAFLGRAAAGGGLLIAGPFTRADFAAPDHFVPADKKLGAAWLRTLFERGDATWYTGDDLRTIGMPVGGICAGQVYLTGDGRLVNWDVFNANANSGYGAINYAEGREPTSRVERGNRAVAAPALAQGFALEVRSAGRSTVRTLDGHGFRDVRFNGEYPLATVSFADRATPIAATLLAYSPFVPLEADDSALPCTILAYTLENRGTNAVDVSLTGWLENAVLRDHGPELFVGRYVGVQRHIADAELAAAAMSVRYVADPDGTPARPPIVFATFDGDDYAGWKVEGEAFGTGPAKGTLPRQQAVSGFVGAGLVNSYLGGDEPRGKLVSKPFTIERPFIGFLIGGGDHPHATCIDLVVEGTVVRTAQGADDERLAPRDWDVRDLIGKRAHLEIVDAASGAWGHVNVDQIEFRDRPAAAAEADLRAQPDWGTMCVAALDPHPADGSTPATVGLAVPAQELPGAAFAAPTPADGEVEHFASPAACGVVGRRATLAPGAQVTWRFVVCWHFPNLRYGDRAVGNRYAKRFRDAADVARYVARNAERLGAATQRWHDTYYDATLPRWLLDRIHSTAANLATTTCQWWRDGRFWAWEGAGCCHGTCGHVWNYAQTLARLFPQLERSVREMQDFAPGVGFDAATGRIGFRGEGWTAWAGDAQAGSVLKAWREHLCSADSAFLERNWPRIRKAMEFLIERDAEDKPGPDGLIEGRQHNTYDIDYFGANTFVGSLYLAALRAAEEMAMEVGDTGFATRCRSIFTSGRDASAALFDGEYFVQRVDLTAHPNDQYADGCLADQLFGQSFAAQVGLGPVYPDAMIHDALASIWRYCWAPDVGPQNAAHAPERWFARPGEAGLFTCTWPKSKHLGARSTRYRDEIWTGIEYQVAAHMAFAGMVTEALAICRGVHERYHPRKHNPWNEIECGDHYARSLASWGVLLGLAGFEHHGPAGRIGFAPRITPDDFRCAFTAATAWGSYAQRRTATGMECTLDVRHGALALRELAVEIPTDRGFDAVEIRIGADAAAVDIERDGARVLIRLRTMAELRPGIGLTLRARPA